jgi:DNA-binding LytR/AlgR family response regulator
LIKSDGHYLELYTEKKKHVIRATFKDIIPMLPTALFTRVHRSFLVNLTKIENFGPGFLSISNQKIPISTRYKETLMKKLNIF